MLPAALYAGNILKVIKRCQMWPSTKPDDFIYASLAIDEMVVVVSPYFNMSNESLATGAKLELFHVESGHIYWYVCMSNRPSDYISTHFDFVE